MGTRPLAVSDTELEVLKALWELGAGTVRDVRQALHAEGSTWAYTTVQTLLNRLLQKSCVSAEKDGKALRYEPAVSRDELLGEHLDDLAERICEGESVPLMLSLMQGRKLSKSDIKQLRALLDDLDGGSGRKATRKVRSS